jgi:hypothetical protein
MREFWRVCHRLIVDERSGTFIGPYRGPYWPGSDTMCMRHNDLRHPSPLAEYNWEFGQWFSAHRPQAVCGAATLEDLLAWFDGFWTQMSEAGYVIRAYELPKDMIRASADTGQAAAIVSPEHLVIESEIKEVMS